MGKVIPNNCEATQRAIIEYLVLKAKAARRLTKDDRPRFRARIKETRKIVSQLERALAVQKSNPAWTMFPAVRAEHFKWGGVRRAESFFPNEELTRPLHIFEQAVEETNEWIRGHERFVLLLDDPVLTKADEDSKTQPRFGQLLVDMYLHIKACHVPEKRKSQSDKTIGQDMAEILDRAPIRDFLGIQETDKVNAPAGDQAMSKKIQRAFKRRAEQTGKTKKELVAEMRERDGRCPYYPETSLTRARRLRED